MFSADGFYPTGDLGRLDADGTLWYAGRREMSATGKIDKAALQQLLKARGLHVRK